jgi:GT2 family glycosyltransferase
LAEQQHTSKARKELSILKDKFKYWRIIRKLGTNTDEPKVGGAATEGKAGGGLNAIAREGLKKVYQWLPDVLLYNPLTFVVYKVGVGLINREVEKIKGNYKSNLILFEGEVPNQFDLAKTTEGIQVSIIIPVHNKYAFTHKCLYSIQQHTNGISYEVIIADDASSDETLKVQTHIGNVKVCRNEKSLGFLGNCNAAAKAAKGKYILFLNNDTVVQPNWLSSLIELIERDQTIGMVGSKLVYPEGILQEAGGIVWKDGSGWNYGKMSDPQHAEFNYVKEVDYISGASLMIRSDLWEQLGGFDIRYTPAYYEDTDLAFEVRRLGFKVVYQPQSVVVHFEGISHGTDTGSGIKKYQEINKQKFIEKWAPVLQQNQFPNEQYLFRARERNQHKKTLLFIDHYAPEFDKDAGSKSCFQYLNLFVKMGLNVKFIGDSFIRTEPYTSVLQQLGIEVLYGFEYQQNWKQWVVQHAADIDYVFLNRPHVTAKYIHFIKANTKARIIYFGHDLHYLREERQYAITKDKNLLQSAEMWRQAEWDIFAKSDVVLYPSSEEIKMIHAQDPNLNAHVLPLNIFAKSTAFEEAYEQLDKKDLLFVGGFNHPPNEDAVVWFANEVFPQVLAQNPDIKFNIVGSKVTPAVLNLVSAHIVVKGFVSDEELRKLYKSCRVVVAPLRYGAGVKGKIIEALYHRCAIVTTPVGVEGISNKEGLISVAETATDFAQAVNDLYNNDQRIAQIYEQTPAYIHTYFSEDGVRKFVQTNIL